ncbi:putative toxin YafO (plasmid) [Klebsiella pneumoniae]|nr:putative toxin YafO [Klebsiella pneumoniae]
MYSLLAIFPKEAHKTASDPVKMSDIAKYAAAFQKLTNP